MNPALLNSWMNDETRRAEAIAYCRKSSEGKKRLLEYANWSEPAAGVADCRALRKFWGYELDEVNAKKIIIFATGMDAKRQHLGHSTCENA